MLSKKNKLFIVSLSFELKSVNEFKFGKKENNVITIFMINNNRNIVLYSITKNLEMK